MSENANGIHQLSAGALACQRVMEAANLPTPVIDNFLRLYYEVEKGQTGIITEEMISPVPDLAKHSDLVAEAKYAELGKKALPELVVCKLNGGLGTGMGLERAKSVLPVKGGLSFNHVVADQLRYYRRTTGCNIPLLHMTSFSTESDIADFMRNYPELSVPGLAPYFNQHRHPKIYADTLMPANEADESLNWNPPGHGDLYAAMLSTGIVDKLLEAGKRWIFVSNSDNLGATPDLAILGYLVENHIPFLMEVSERTMADSKGGHLAVRRADGRLILREAAQAPKGPDGTPIAEFQDIRKYRYFNSNSQWGDLLAWRDAARKHGGAIPLPLIRNPKTVNPRDSKSAKVYQIETAMGAAIEVFEGASAVVIPRSRFSPVKSTTDLLAVRSDAYILQEDQSLVLHPTRVKQGPPIVALDSRYYKIIDQLDARFGVVPSLLHAVEFRVEGDFLFSSPLEIEGRVHIIDKRTTPAHGPVVFDPAVKKLSNEVYTLTDQGAERKRSA